MGTYSETLPVVGSSTRLTGTRLWIVRGLWAILVIAVLAAEVKGLSNFFADHLTICQGFCVAGYLWPQDVAALRSIGLSPEFHVWYYLLVDTLPVTLTLFVVAFLLAWRRSNDWLALYTSLFLVVLPVAKRPYIAGPGWDVVETIIGLIFLTGGPLLMYIFPDGKFVPRWIRWLVPPMMAWMVLNWFQPEIGDAAHFDIIGLTTFVLLLTGIGALLYRYFRVSGPAEKLQIKWAVLGLTLRPISELGIRRMLLPTLFATVLAPGLSRVFFHMATIPIFSTIPFIFTGVALGIAIFRYRLWDIDFIINRTLVYASLTAALGTIFVGGFFVLRWLLERALGGQQAVLPAIIATAVIVGLFSPSQSWLRRFVDRRFYGIKVDYVAAIKAYGKAKEEASKPQGTQTHFGPYTDLVLLGRGGMGEVYRAQHPTLNRAVAIKIMPPHVLGNDTAQKRFIREAQTVARLKHPNIVTLHDVGEQDGRPYMVMEYVDGPDLSTLLKQKGRLTYEEAYPILEDLASALDYAHSQNIIHRDVKPSNVVLERVTGSGQGRTTRAVLMDFGIARSLGEGTNLTHSGMIGTMDYISPEQIQGSQEIDGRADVYSLSVMTYQLLTGELPFKHNNLGAMVMAHLMEPPPDPRQIVPSIPSQAAEAILKGMRKNPAQRFATAGEFVAA